LLARTRAELRNWLRARGADWIEDPSNENVAFERVRARRALAPRPDEAQRLAEAAAYLRQEAEALDAAAAAWIVAHVRFDAGRAFFPASALADEAAARGLSALIAAVAGADGEPQAARVASLVATAAAPSFRGATLGGAQLRPGGGRELELSRDPGGLMGRGRRKTQTWLELPAGAQFVWDGRLELTATEPGWRVAAAAAEPDPTAPVFSRQGQTSSLPEAQEAGVAAAWLLAAHVAHLLPKFTPQ
jgi:tRNA(Ile)-lysidine synthase